MSGTLKQTPKRLAVKDPHSRGGEPDRGEVEAHRGEHETAKGAAFAPCHLAGWEGRLLVGAVDDGRTFVTLV
jgi:hypothetical protein